MPFGPRQEEEDGIRGFMFSLKAGRWVGPRRASSAQRCQLDASYEIHSTNKTLRVVGVRDNDADQPPTLVLRMHKPRAESHLSRRSPRRRAAKATPPNVEVPRFLG